MTYPPPQFINKSKKKGPIICPNTANLMTVYSIQRTKAQLIYVQELYLKGLLSNETVLRRQQELMEKLTDLYALYSTQIPQTKIDKKEFHIKV